MYVRDLEVVKEFYIRFLGQKRENYIIIQNRTEKLFSVVWWGNKAGTDESAGNAGSEESVGADGLYPYRNFSGKQRESGCYHRKTVWGGYDVLSGPRITGDGYYESTVLGPEDNQIEITE